MLTCSYCEKFIPTGAEICGDCMEKLGLTSGEGVRQGLPCQRCNHPELVRALAREFSSYLGEDGGREVAPMGVTVEPRATRSLFSNRPTGVAPPVASQVLGILEMYICVACGFTEWYCRDPHSIPIGKAYGTEAISVAPTAPYR